MQQRAPLNERKRQQARERIVKAAGELFAEKGFENVSVADIADRAEVGRTTFFRYFGDKQEVVFADEQGLGATISAAEEREGVPPPRSLGEAIGQLREIARELCEQATRDPVSYERHYDLVDDHDVLRAREALKAEALAQRLAQVLLARGADERTAVLASQIAMACFQSARRRLGSDPARLVVDTDEAFEQVLRLGGVEEPARRRPGRGREGGPRPSTRSLPSVTR